jgi:hypothetical protein
MLRSPADILQLDVVDLLMTNMDDTNDLAEDYEVDVDE